MEAMTTKTQMIEQQLLGRDIVDERVIDAMREVDRAKFVPESMREHAYDDGPLPIGEDQTISQPYIVAYMAQALELEADDRVLEIGTGCGYNAAVLSRICRKVYSIEVVESLAKLARKNLEAADDFDVELRQGDGYQGWPEEAPFDAVMITAAPPRIPEPLKEQLKVGGRLLSPIGRGEQTLVLLRKEDGGSFRRRELLPVRFVPMTGEAQTIG